MSDFYDSKQYKKLLEDIADLIIATIKTPLHIPSQFIRENLRHSIHISQHKVTIFVPVYWAKVYHDGRKPVRPVRGNKLLWYTDQRKDPRNRGGYPKTKGARVRATKAMIQKDVAADYQTIKAYRQSKGRPLTATDYQYLYTTKKLRLVFSEISQKPRSNKMYPFFSLKSGSAIDSIRGKMKDLALKASKEYLRSNLDKKFRK